MSDPLAVILIGGSFFAAVSAVFWVLFMVIERINDRRHYCSDALSWCVDCMDEKQRAWFNYKREMAR